MTWQGDGIEGWGKEVILGASNPNKVSRKKIEKIEKGDIIKEIIQNISEH